MYMSDGRFIKLSSPPIKPDTYLLLTCWLAHWVIELRNWHQNHSYSHFKTDANREICWKLGMKGMLLIMLCGGFFLECDAAVTRNSQIPVALKNDKCWFLIHPVCPHGSNRVFAPCYPHCGTQSWRVVTIWSFAGSWAEECSQSHTVQ